MRLNRLQASTEEDKLCPFLVNLNNRSRMEEEKMRERHCGRGKREREKEREREKMNASRIISPAHARRHTWFLQTFHWDTFSSPSRQNGTLQPGSYKSRFSISKASKKKLLPSSWSSDKTENCQFPSTPQWVFFEHNGQHHAFRQNKKNLRNPAYQSTIENNTMALKCCLQALLQQTSKQTSKDDWSLILQHVILVDLPAWVWSESAVVYGYSASWSATRAQRRCLRRLSGDQSFVWQRLSNLAMLEKRGRRLDQEHRVWKQFMWSKRSLWADIFVFA